MTNHTRQFARWARASLFPISCLAVACRPSDVLSVPAPAGVVAGAGLAGQAGAEAQLTGARGEVFTGLAGFGGLLEWAGLLSDEFTWSYFSYDASDANIDARMTAGTHGFGESGDYALQNLISARAALVLAIPNLVKYEPSSGQPRVGEAYALMGYVELYIAEDFCGGATLSISKPGGGIQYGAALSTDSMLATAEAHFDSALAVAGSNDTVTALANVGLARTRLDRGNVVQAAAAANAVPTNFVYNNQLAPSYASASGFIAPQINVYAGEFSANYGCPGFNVADREGTNGLNFVSAGDPRLLIDSTISQTCDGQYAGATPGTWYYPLKFGNPTTGLIPIATGIEARLIEAEAALQTDRATGIADLNALRTSGYTVPSPGDTVYSAGTGGVAGLAPLAVPSSDSAATSLLFRERAFWLFGTDVRLGDLRRLIRQYHRDQSVVFPVGPYPNGSNPGLPVPIPSYGTDVDLTLPTPASGQTTTNPNYKGCLSPTSTA